MNIQDAERLIAKNDELCAEHMRLLNELKAMLEAAPTPPAQDDEPVWPNECESLCKAAENMQRAFNELWKAEYPEELDDDDEHMDIDEARLQHTESWKALDTAIHYMRKRMGAPLYTHPADDGLRKAAEEYLAYNGNKATDGTARILLINLRNALKGKS